MMLSLRWSGRKPFVRGLQSLHRVVLGGLPAFLLAACVGVEAVESPVPAYNVHYSCNISTINAALEQNDLPNLDSQPGVVLVNRYQNVSDNIGVCGLLLYHAATEDAFYAYDLACPYCYHRGTATPIGMKGRAEAEVIEVDRRRIVLSVAAYDEIGPIGKGTHERFLIDAKKFIAKAESKGN